MRWSNSIPVPSRPVSSSRAGSARYRVLSTGYWLLLATVRFSAAAPPADEKHVSVYSPVATYTLPVLDRAGHEYVGLLELLEPLGRVSSETQGIALATPL